uniref:Neprosin PEP catalytic domain-containing protein n=1 Tax=Leersia perrieri TaxID=77586 RepID=A0A0D9UW23_9ORYZ
MVKSSLRNVLFLVLFLTSSTAGGCFPTVEKELRKNWGKLMAPTLHVNLSSLNYESTQSARTYNAVYGWSPENGATEFYGLEATMDVYGFNLEHGQETGGFIWIRNKDETQGSNYIGAGWNVYPEGYNDSHTHFTTFWFVDPSKGCLDMNCPGFQSTGGSHPVVPGQMINPVSSPSHNKQYITIRISKDQNTGDWKIYYGFNGEAKIIGFYPRHLFTSLSYKPVSIIFGGVASHKEHQPSPPMGSGIAPPKDAASFSNLKFFDADGHAYPIDRELPDISWCYPITDIASYKFFYGGPGNVCS